MEDNKSSTSYSKLKFKITKLNKISYLMNMARNVMFTTHIGFLYVQVGLKIYKDK